MKRVERLADGVLLAISAYLVSILLFLVSARGLSARFFSVGVVALGLFAARWLKANVKINIALLFLSSLVSLYVCDIALAITASSRANWELRRWLTFPNDTNEETSHARIAQNSKEKPGFDSRDKLRVIKDLERQGISAYPAVVPHDLLTVDTSASQKVFRALSIAGKETLPLGGLSNVLTVFCNESGEYITYTSDEHGFNNPAGLWQNRQVEVVAVGDSFTHGACVPRDENFVGVIRARRPLTLSLGMDSNGPTMMLASLKEYAQRLKPKIVLWFYFEGNDLRDMDYERLSTLLMRYLTGGWTQNLFDRQGEIDSALEAYIEQARKKKSLRIGFEDTITIRHLREAFALWYGQGDAGTTVSATTAYFSAEVTEAEMNQFRSVLKEALSTVRGWGGQMYFVYLPEWARYAEPQSANKNRDRVLSVVHTLQLPLIDLHPVFTQVPDPVGLFPFHRNNHYNSEGHRLVGEEVLRVLSETDGGSR